MAHDKQVLDRWHLSEEEERAKSREMSVEFLRKADKISNPVTKLTSQWRILPEWRKRLAELMLADENSEVYGRVAPPAKFPKDKKGT